MGCSGLQTESQECETSERKCESFPVIDTSSVCPSLERKDKENCESVRGGGGFKEKLGYILQRVSSIAAQ